MPTQNMNEYWISNHEINKRVITKEIQCFLGPSAHVRPYSFEVGYPDFPRTSTISDISPGRRWILDRHPRTMSHRRKSPQPKRKERC